MNRNTLSNGIIFGSTGTLGSRISLDLAQMNTNLILHGKSLEKLIKLDNEIKNPVQDNNIEFSDSAIVESLFIEDSELDDYLNSYVINELVND